MVDRAGRERVFDLTLLFMQGEIGSFEFDDALSKIETRDKTLKEVIKLLWFFYDDLKDEKINLTKSGWDDLNRLLLILKSDAILKQKRKPLFQRVKEIFKKESSLYPSIYPFPSFKSLRAVYKSSNFKKIKFKESTKELKSNNILGWLIFVGIFIIWIAFGVLANKTVFLLFFIFFLLLIFVYNDKEYEIELDGEQFS